ncbi:MAG: hypothetical protein WCI72_01865 [archaeon]
MLNKRAAGEGISWAAGLVAILMIIIFALIAYLVGHLGEKKPITIDLTNNNGFLSEFQRVSAYTISSDFNSSEKGKILSEIYSNVKEEKDYGGNYGWGAQPVGTKIVGMPNFPIVGYSPILNIGYGLGFVNSFYLSCNHCASKYFSFSLERSKNAK